MTNLITRMVLDEISLVDDPANPEAQVAIVKARGAGQLTDGVLAEIFDGLRKAAVERVGAAFPSDPTAVERAAAFFKERTMDLEQLEKALSDATAALEKAGKDIEAKDTEIAKLKGERDEALKKSKPDPKETEEEMLKSLPEPIRKRLEAAELATKAATERLEKMAEQQEEATAIEKAKGLGVGDAKVVGPLLLRIQKGKATAADAAEVERLLKAAANQKAMGSLYGSAGSHSADPADPEAMLHTKAEDIRKSNPKLTFEQAYQKAMEENPAVYDEYLAKRRERA